MEDESNVAFSVLATQQKRSGEHSSVHRKAQEELGLNQPDGTIGPSGAKYSLRVRREFHLAIKSN